MVYTAQQKIFILLRLFMGWLFLWAFLDKLFGLGFSTTVDKSWLAGGSPTYGFLKFASYGPLSFIYQGLAGSNLVDWLVMLGFLGIGLALILGVARRLSCYSGALISFLMWSSLLPPKNNPLFDEHILYILVFLLLLSVNAGQWFGFANSWSKTKLVKKFPILE